MPDISNEEIIEELRSLHDAINRTRRISAYSQDEGSRVAARAMMYIYGWHFDKNQGKKAKDDAMKMLRKAVLANDPSDPWESLIISQSAIESFLNEVDEGL